MATSEGATLTEATRRVMAMRRQNVSRARIANALGVTMDVIRTIERLGAGKTRNKARRRILRWMAQGGTALDAPPPRPAGKRGPGRPPGSGKRRRRSTGRRGRRPGRPPASASVVPVRSADVGTVTLEVEGGRVVRLRGGRSYLLRGTTLYEVLPH
jgi:hypothetical protein